MAENSKIEWTTHTWNPWIGCTEVSPGCDNCYARTLAARYGWAEWGAGKPRHRTSDANWRKPFTWNRSAIDAAPRPRVFPSLCDPFDNDIPRAWHYDLWATIDFTPNLDWLLLTKRIGNAAKIDRRWPDNVWLGISVVNQEEADRDIPKLLKVPARVRFLSCEPLLGPIKIGEVDILHLDWVIVGGESGPGARPMQLAWARSLREQCEAAGVAYFLKQLGDKPMWGNVHVEGCTKTSLGPKGGDPREWPIDLRNARAFPATLTKVQSA